MDLVSAETVRRCVGGLSDEQLAAFVASLWAARGAETVVVEAGRVVEVSRGGETRRLWVSRGRRLPAPADDVDTVVLSRPASSVRGTSSFAGRIVDTDDIHAMLLYAVSRSDADDLCRRFFGRPLAAASEPTRSVTAHVPEHSASLVVGLVGLSLLVASVFGAPMLYGGDAPVFGAPDSVGADTDGADERTPTPERTAQSVSVASGSLPPGVGPDGTIDENALADAHAGAVTGQSYRLTITHREYADGRPAGYQRETVFVASPTVYRTEVEGAGDLERSPLVISGVEAFADGETRYQRGVAADEFDRPDAIDVLPVRGVRNGEGRYADRVEQYVQWHLSVLSSELVDTFEREGTRYYWIRLGDDPYPGVENSSGSALVDEYGVVHEVVRQYEYPGSEGLSAVVSLRYTDFGTTTVSPPAWVDAVRTPPATADATTATERNTTQTPQAGQPPATATATATATST